jgi:hypothetical protein
MLESPNPGNGEAEARSEMSTPANTFARTRADSVHQWIEFIKGELGLCLTFCVLAAIKYRAGNRNSAERSIDHAEKAYAAVLLFLSHRSLFKGLRAGEIQELTADANRLREKLDALQRFRKMSRGAKETGNTLDTKSSRDFNLGFILSTAERPAAAPRRWESADPHALLTAPSSAAIVIRHPTSR